MSKDILYAGVETIVSKGKTSFAFHVSKQTPTNGQIVTYQAVPGTSIHTFVEVPKGLDRIGAMKNIAGRKEFANRTFQAFLKEEIRKAEELAVAASAPKNPVGRPRKQPSTADLQKQVEALAKMIGASTPAPAKKAA